MEYRENTGYQIKLEGLAGAHQPGPCNKAILRNLELYPKSNEDLLETYVIFLTIITPINFS